LHPFEVIQMLLPTDKGKCRAVSVRRCPYGSETGFLQGAEVKSKVLFRQVPISRHALC
jgi:hypothetical protein